MTEADPSDIGKCPWCGDPVERKLVGGNVRRFCCRDCKNQYHTACRAYVDREIREGRLDASALRLRHAAQDSEVTEDGRRG